MTHPVKSVVAVAFAALALMVGAEAWAQVPPPPGLPGPGRGQGRGARVNQNEVQLWFDAMVVVQAQKALDLSDAQYPQFVGRLKALQDVRRRALGARNRLIGEINKLTAPANTTLDEAQLKEKLKALADLQAKNAADVRKAYDDLDQVLDLRQQGRFRVFEEQVERRKFEFLLNARRREGTLPR